jgi:hypothetical protein
VGVRGWKWLMHTLHSFHVYIFLIIVHKLRSWHVSILSKEQLCESFSHCFSTYILTDISHLS